MSAKKKPAGKKVAAKRTAKKKAAKKKAVVRAERKSAPWTAAKKMSSRPATDAVRTPSKRPTVVEPGPPAVTAPPVEEPARLEEAIGIVTHYYSHLGVALVQLLKGTLRTGDRIHIRGHASDFSQTIGSMEYEHQHIERAEAGQCVGIQAVEQAREHDIVYLVQ